MSTIIGLSGPPGVGKSTAAEQLRLRLWELTCCNGGEPNIQILSMADALKQIVHDLFGVPKAQLWGPSRLREAPLEFTLDRAPHVTTVRGLLQFVGTDIGRDTISTDIWVNAVARRINGRFVLIPDIRFDSELAWLGGQSSHYLGLLSFGDPEKAAMGKARGEEHRCESGLSADVLAPIDAAGRAFRYIRPAGHSSLTLLDMRQSLDSVAAVIFDGGRFAGGAEVE